MTRSWTQQGAGAMKEVAGNNKALEEIYAMCFSGQGDAPIEFKTEELKERGPNGERVVQPVLTIWNSTPCRDVSMVSGRWEGCREFGMTWEQFLELHESMSKQIAILKKLIEAGKIVAK